MLLKRLAPSLPPEVAALVPLLEPHVRTTEAVILTPRATLHATLAAALAGEGGGDPKSTTSKGTSPGRSSRPPIHPSTSPAAFAAARRDAGIDAALDMLLHHCLERVPVSNGTDIRQKHKWDGFGVLEDVLHADGGVIEIAGGKGVGKSLFALHAALRTLIADPAATAYWIDTEGAFNAARAKAVAEALDADVSVLDRLTVARVFRLEPELMDELGRVRDDANARVLVIDNIASLFRDVLMGTTAQGHAAMVVAMEEVAELTYSTDLLATLVVNSTASSIPTNPLSAFSTTTVKPALGATLTFTLDVELLLQDTGRVFGLADEGERDRAGSAPGLRVLVEVLKSRTSPSGTWGVVETDGISLFNVEPPPEEDEKTLYRSAGGDTGRPAMGGLGTTLEPAIPPLRSKRS